MHHTSSENTALSIQHAGDSHSGYFGPGSAIWQVNREYIMMLGSMRALLLQVAHPAIAAGVSQYSNFKEDAFGRAQRTFASLSIIIFGNKMQAAEAGRQLVSAHRSIKGKYADADVRKSYYANDPQLKLWVLATIIDTNMCTYEFVHGKQPEEFKERFYREWMVAGQLMGIPADVFPEGWNLFKRYMEKMLAPGRLKIDETGRAVCHSILYHPHLPSFILNWLAVAFLPPHLTEAFGLKRRETVVRNARYFIRFIRVLFRISPKTLRYIPAYFQAQRRVALSKRRRPSLTGRFYNWVNRRIQLPLALPADR